MGLLDILAERMACPYLSDLHFLPRPNEALRQAVASMPLDEFSEYEWKDAAEYLCGVMRKRERSARNDIGTWVKQGSLARLPCLSF